MRAASARGFDAYRGGGLLPALQAGLLEGLPVEVAEAALDGHHVHVDMRVDCHIDVAADPFSVASARAKALPSPGLLELNDVALGVPAVKHDAAAKMPSSLLRLEVTT